MSDKYLTMLRHFNRLSLTQVTKGIFQKQKLKFFNLWGSVEWGGGEGGSATVFSLFSFIRIEFRQLSSPGSVLNVAMQKLVNFNVFLF